MLLKPSKSYEINLPEGIREDYDEHVASFWVPDEPLLLQLSSYLRERGEQVGAAKRLSDRISKHAGAWRTLDRRLLDDETLDQAASEFRDTEGVVWIHAYFVWPHLTIYATVSGPNVALEEPNWATNSLSSICLTQG